MCRLGYNFDKSGQYTLTVSIDGIFDHLFSNLSIKLDPSTNFILNHFSNSIRSCCKNIKFKYVVVVLMRCSSVIGSHNIPTLRVNNWQSMLVGHETKPVIFSCGTIFDIVSHFWILSEHKYSESLASNVSVNSDHHHITAYHFRHFIFTQIKKILHSIVLW